MNPPPIPLKPAHGAFFNVTDIIALYNALVKAGEGLLAADLATRCFGFADEETRKRLAAYIENVRADNDGDVECDGASGSCVSVGSGPGAYVLVWRWVSNVDAGLAKEDEE